MIENLALQDLKKDQGAYLLKPHLSPHYLRDYGKGQPCSVILRRVNPWRDEECYYREYISVPEIIGTTRNYTQVPEEKLFIRTH
jgi:hypothetical protein